MKKVIKLLLIALTLLLVGCSKKEKKDISIVCTSFSAYDWVSQIMIGQTTNVDIMYLLDNGVDIHSFQPSVEDIVSIKQCNLFIYIGGQSEKWIDDVLKNSKNIKTIKMMDIIEDDLFEHDHHDHEKDEHIWLSVKNAIKIVNEISKNIIDIDEKNKELYKLNTNNYLKELDDLDKNYTNALTNATCKTVLFADRFPFIYLFNDYNLNYYAAFDGCSAETEASIETVKILSGKVDELNLKVIMKIEGSNDKLSNRIKENSETKDQKILTLDSLQSVKTKENKTYLSIMNSNLETLIEATK